MAEDKSAEEVTNRILTVPNVISFIRLCFIPAFLYLLLNGQNIPACVVFAIAAGTDWVDGQIARRTHCVSKLGQLLDPFVDRCLLISGVIGLLLVGRIPVWIVVLVLVRDLFLLIGGYWLLKNWKVRVAVIYPGKFAATLMYVGFAALLLYIPVMTGLGITDISWLPGFNGEPYGWGIWFVYASLILNVFTTSYYIRTAWRGLQEAKRAARESKADDEPGRA